MKKKKLFFFPADGYFLYWVLRSFSEHFFYRAHPGNCYFMYKFRISTTRYSKKPLFTDTFYTRSRNAIWMLEKNREKCWIHFDPDARVSVLSNWHTLWQIFFSNLYLFGSIFSIIVWTNRLHDFDKGVCFSDSCCYDNGP